MSLAWPPILLIMAKAHGQRLIILAAVTALLLLPGCASKRGWISDSQLKRALNFAEEQASDGGRKVLSTGREMTLIEQTIVRGSCWDYANEVYNRAGFPNTRYSRQSVFKGTMKRGPYADVSQIEPGDFLYYINHSYHNIQHSAIFVTWFNIDKKQAIMLSYGGEKRKEPGRYLPYDLSHVFRIIRPNSH